MPVRETGLYYLQSRYYNPTWGRFLNADVYVSTGQGMLGNNMFTYCLNNPVNAVDPTGHAGFMRISICDDPTKEMFFGFGGGGGGGSAYALAAASASVKLVIKVKEIIDNPSEARAQRNLKKYGATFYNGILVFSADLPVDNSAFSFGVIVIDDFYKNVSSAEFSETLNHERGHFLHMQTVGVVSYTITTAIPSLVCAGINAVEIPYISSTIRTNYYNLPWERIADYYGGVNQGYPSRANTAGALYWVYTFVVGLGAP